MDTYIERAWYLPLPTSIGDFERAREAASAAYRRDTGMTISEGGSSWLTLSYADAKLVLKYTIHGVETLDGR